MILNNLNNSGDLRSKLGKPKAKMQYREPIQVVVTNTNAINSKRDNSGIVRQQSHQNVKEIHSMEREEGEWQESEEDGHEEEEDKEEQRLGQMNTEEGREGEKQEGEEGEHNEDEDSSEEDVLAKEIQGPKGSVIKVVPPKPRIASTVWARLNHAKSETSDSYLKSRYGNNLVNVIYLRYDKQHNFFRIFLFPITNWQKMEAVCISLKLLSYQKSPQLQCILLIFGWNKYFMYPN